MITLYHPNIDSTTNFCSDLPDSERKHLRTLRVRLGEPIRIVNGKGTACSGTLAQFETSVCIIDHLELAPSLELIGERILLLAKIAQPRLEWAIEALTPLGLTKLIIIETEFTQPNAIRRDRLLRVAETAMKQCQRSQLPEVDIGLERNGIAWKDALILLKGMPDNIKRIVADPDGEPISIIRTFPEQDFLFVVGPEAGLSKQEVDELLDRKYIPVTLGARLLRSELASVVAFANLL